MATGTGKTAVMGMVIAWNVANVAAGGNRRHPGRYFTSFVAITPGHTVRERLAVLDPSGPDNVYDELSLVPAGLRGDLGRVKLRVVNFQAFQCRDRLGEATGDARRLLRRGDAGRDPESPGAMLRRVLRGLPDRAKVCVLNDEAHHCYLPEEGRRTGSDKDENKRAALWFGALAALRDEDRLGRVHDFSATPMFIETAASTNSVMFPWVVSDFPLMDGIESGLVKIPRVPVDDDSDEREVVWRNLYRNTNPKTIRSGDVPPPPLGDALRAMYVQYADALERWEHNGLPTPPVFIVVANTIANAEALYHHIAGWVEHTDGGAVAYRPGACELFSNIRSDGSGYEDRVRTLLVHSKIEGDDSICRDEPAWPGCEGPGRALAQDRRRRRRPPSYSRGLEHCGSTGRVGRADPLRRVGVDAHRGVGHAHRRPHPRLPGVRHPAAVRAGDRPSAAPLQLRQLRRRRPSDTGVRGRARRAVRLHAGDRLLRPGAAEAEISSVHHARTPRPANRVPRAHGLHDRAGESRRRPRPEPGAGAHRQREYAVHDRSWPASWASRR